MSDATTAEQPHDPGMDPIEPSFTDTMKAIADALSEQLPGVGFCLFFFSPSDTTPRANYIANTPRSQTVEAIRSWLHIQQYGKQNEAEAALKEQIGELQRAMQLMPREMFREGYLAARTKAGIMKFLAPQGVDEAWIEFVDAQAEGRLNG